METKMSLNTPDSNSSGVKLERHGRSPHLNIVGISAGYHDSACCILQDGKIVAAVQEERFTRLKNDKSFPRNALRYCLKHAGLAISDIDCMAYYEDPTQKLGRQIWMGMMPDLSAERRKGIQDRMTKPLPQETIRGLFGYKGPIEIVDHHLSHAASSFFFS